ETIAACGATSQYRRAMAEAESAAGALADPAMAPYLMPMAYRNRTLFKMDFAQAAYMAELRTAPAGHFSYRRVAWEMFQALRRRYPDLTRSLRVTDPDAPLDLLQR
ncbi:MAG: FAD-dependent thymidylate synthase, partial [Terriglobales bacterium]